MSDNFNRIKHIGYCWAKLPPNEDNVEFEDFVKYAQFQLCMATHRLMKDDIWGDYTPEEILIEYYALLFYNNAEQAEQFLRNINGVVESDYDWILEQDAKETKESQLGEEDSLSFNPQELGE